MEQDKWKNELERLKAILNSCGLDHSTKWGTDVYTWKGKNIVSCGGFKNHFVLWFYNGVFLTDKARVLIAAQEGITKALRQWRFTHIDQLDEELIRAYVYEAVDNESAGRVWKAEKKPLPEVPEILENAMNADAALRKAFNSLTPYKQREYIEHLNTAKKEDTRIKRMEKAITQILKGVGLHDKYKC